MECGIEEERRIALPNQEPPVFRIAMFHSLKHIEKLKYIQQ